jgi:NADH-ubiquinone oxidoreductase chain 2
MVILFFFDSTISHIGFILLALSINTEQSIDSLIFYIIQYTITNLNTFLIILAFGYLIKNSVVFNNTIKTIRPKGSEQDINNIDELKGEFYNNPLIAVSLTICLLSMAGLPPLIGFFSKQFVLYSAVESGYYFMAIVGILISIISATYYLKIIRILHETKGEIIQPLPQPAVGAGLPLGLPLGQGEDEKYNKVIKEDVSQNLNYKTTISNFHSLMISSLTLLILLFVLNPSIILKSTQLLSLCIFNS